MPATLRGWVWGVGDVNIQVNFKHMCTLHCRVGLAGWVMLTFMLTSSIGARYVAGLGRGDDVNLIVDFKAYVHATLQGWVWKIGRLGRRYSS